MFSKRHLLRSSMVVGFFSFLGSLTGIAVEISIAAHLGLSRSSDTFYIAFTVPYIITNLISATGQFSLVPFFSSLDSDGSARDLWHGFSYALNLVALGLAAIAILGALLAPWVILAIAPGFTHAQSAAAAGLARWLFFIIVPAGVAEIFRSFLFSRHRFALGSAAGFIRNVAVIGFILFGFHRYGDGSIVMGYFAGYCAQVLVLGGQVIAAFPVRYTLALRGAGMAFRRLHGAGASQIIAALGWQGVALVERVIASFLPPGTITALNYGLKIMSTLAELVAGSVGTSALPALSHAVVIRAVAVEQQIFRNALEISLILLSPVMACCLALAQPMMQLLFQHGRFSPEATRRMALVFFCYCLSLLFFSAIRLL
ncbi:MAG: murein biosynthesis integral membrane protein MurJ, partial [Terriglobia bacterium]